jgi:shikimate kinase
VSQNSSNNQTEAVIDRLRGRSIVMVGLMGAGKTTIGRRLAQRLGLPFVDADKEIEVAAGKTIQEIFDDHGEEYFRSGEARVISRLLDEEQKVLATGGGAFMDPATREIIADKAVSVWLSGDLALLMKRVRRKSHRPLLKAPDPEAVMQRLIDERYPTYAQADCRVESRDVPHAYIVDDVLSSLAGTEDGQTAQ